MVLTQLWLAFIYLDTRVYREPAMAAVSAIYLMISDGYNLMRYPGFKAMKGVVVEEVAPGEMVEPLLHPDNLNTR